MKTGDLKYLFHSYLCIKLQAKDIIITHLALSKGVHVFLQVHGQKLKYEIQAGLLHEYIF